MKLATITTNKDQLIELLPLLREIYFSSDFELLCLVSSQEESELRANPACHRKLREYSAQALEEGEQLQDMALLEAARRALLEERPDLVLWPSDSYLKEALAPTLRLYGIGEYQLGQGAETSLSAILSRLRSIDLACTSPHPGKVSALDFLAPHWERLGAELQSPCLLHSTPQLTRLCAEKFPHIEFHSQASLERYPLALCLLGLSFSENPQQDISRLRARSEKTICLEPVNSPIAGARYNFCHGLYDNEFALVAPELDLKTQLGEGHQSVVWDQRCGQAGPHPPPHPDQKYPAFFTTWPGSQMDWTDRFSIPGGTSLKIVFADSGNVAGSILHHTAAVNRFTTSKAWALASEPHPFIGPKESDEHTFFIKGQSQASPELKRVLEEADCIVFFEDDDEQSPHWSFPLHQYLENTPKIHLYIGYRVHAKTPKLARPGRTIVTPLPHLLKMYPGSHFYAGFPPLTIDDGELTKPQSAIDGICRFLHTPSLPHWTTSQFPYHKDTEAYLNAARALKQKYGSQIEFHQVGGWSYREVSAARRLCDVTFNQLRGFHGLSGDEAMMAGRPCVQFFDQYNINRHLEYWGLDAEFPWLSCRREKLLDTFEELFCSPEKRATVGAASRDFMKKYFSPQKGILPLLYHCYGAVRGYAP